MWGGRFDKPPAEEAQAFTRSFPWDRRMYREDIVASLAHAEMLGAQSIIPAQGSRALVQALETLLDELLAAGGPRDDGDEDIHTYVERVLTDRIGDPGRRLHTARSRNDQVATDSRLYCKGLCIRLADALLDLLEVVVHRADEEAETLLPGFTHLQSAQPVTLGHYLLAIYEMLSRDLLGILAAFSAADACPLGAGAVAGVPFPVDRLRVATSLGFSRITHNSIDSVADRDYLIALLNACAGLMLHLSRWCEDLVIWSSPAYAMVELDDAYATGSSMMPQKKNPDAVELIRGRAGTLLGIAAGLMATLKGVPLSYGLDLQEDKQALFRTEDCMLPALRVMRGAIESLSFRRDRMAEVAGQGHPTATEIADYLAEHGVPFRTAHGIAGRVVRRALERGCGLDELDDTELAEIDERLKPDVRSRLSLAGAVARRHSIGGTAPERVRDEAAQARGWIELQAGRVRELQARGLPQRLVEAWRRCGDVPGG